MMKKIFVLLLIITIFSQCANDVEPTDEQNVCTIPATVTDLTGLDGCGFVFVLENGEVIEPIRMISCGTPDYVAPKDPLDNFEFMDGKKVLIEYEVITEMASTCQSGAIAKITCITEVEVNAEF
jgi:hypothetical protein